MSVNRVNDREQIGACRHEDIFTIRRETHIAPFMVASGEITNGGERTMLIFASIIQFKLIVAGTDTKHETFRIQTNCGSMRCFTHRDAFTLSQVPHTDMTIDGRGHKTIVQVRQTNLRNTIGMAVKRTNVCIVVE